ncbi:Pentatricopeptide repeat [Balamuthia mandrillaris]
MRNCYTERYCASPELTGLGQLRRLLLLPSAPLRRLSSSSLVFEEHLPRHNHSRTRRGLLKFVDLAEKRDGRVGGGLLTRLVRKARNRQEVEELIEEATHRFGSVPWQLLAAAAHVSAGSHVDDPRLASTLLSRIPEAELPNIREGVLRAVLGNASKHQNAAIAMQAFNLLVASKGPLSATDYARVIHSGVEPHAERQLVEELLHQPCAVDLDPRVIGVVLKACTRRHDFELAKRVWQWAAPRLRANYGDKDLGYVTAQYLLLCGETGDLPTAKQVWEQAKGLGLAQLPVITGSMFSVLATHGADKETIALLNNVAPDSINSHMLVAALTAFSHAGNVASAHTLLEQVESRNDGTLVIDLRAYTALVDAYARKGDFKTALQVIEQSKSRGVGEDGVMWMTVLSPCRHFKNLPVAQQAFDAIQRLAHPEHRAAAYVLMADVYKACGNEPAAQRMQQERVEIGLAKERGAVTVTVHGTSHVFHVREIPPELSHASEAINKKLEEWSLWLGACGVPDESLRCQHSEQLALAYAVTQGLKHVVLRKNLRVCSACHEASKHLTILESISIYHWDRSRLHVMEDGKCSCGDHY